VRIKSSDCGEWSPTRSYRGGHLAPAEAEGNVRSLALVNRLLLTISEVHNLLGKAI